MHLLALRATHGGEHAGSADELESGWAGATKEGVREAFVDA